MRTMLLAACTVAILLIGLTGCQSAPINSPSAPPPLPPGGAALLSPEAAASARTLYVAKCAKCHKFYDPAKYNDLQWHTWMTKMSRKAKLKPNETELVT